MESTARKLALPAALAAAWLLAGCITMPGSKSESSSSGSTTTAAAPAPSGPKIGPGMNERGDVIDPSTGAVVAGVRTPDGRGLADARILLRQGAPAPALTGENTTLGVVATNAVLTKTQASLVARMAHDGFARAIAPVHTPSDGDTIFAISTARHEGVADVGLIGALAADVMARAIVNAVRHAEPLPSLPSVRSLETASR